MVFWMHHSKFYYSIIHASVVHGISSSFKIHRDNYEKASLMLERDPKNPEYGFVKMKIERWVKTICVTREIRNLTVDEVQILIREQSGAHISGISAS
jgi:hypothetical protein